MDSTWIERNDAWRSRKPFRPEGSERELNVGFYIATGKAFDEAARRFGLTDRFEVTAEQYESVVRDAVEEVWPADGEVYVEPWGGPKTGGPVPDEQYGVALGLALDWVSRGIAVVTVAGWVYKALQKLKAMTGHRVVVKEGAAYFLAAKVVGDMTGDIAPRLIESRQLIRALPERDEMEAPFVQAYVITMEGAGRAITLTVTRYGDVLVEGDGI